MSNVANGAILGLEVLDSLSPKVSEKSSEEIDSSLDQMLGSISGEISLLHKFSNTIRRASKEIHKQKAAKNFRILDEEGNDVENFLEELFVHHIRDQFPEVGESIRQRLAKTMLLRRRRILYRRSRYGSKPTRTRPQPAQPTAPRTRVRTVPEQDLPQNADQEANIALGKRLLGRTTRSTVQSTAMTATTLAPDHFKKSSTPSVVSMSRTVALSSHDNLRFPPAPCGGLMRKYNRLKAQRMSVHPVVAGQMAEATGESGEKAVTTSITKAEILDEKLLRKDWEECVAAVGEIICPFCFCTLPVAEVTNDKKWKEHVKGDLDPYVCLFEECDAGEELYSHSNSWLKHMREHTLKWKCKSKLHAPYTASSKQDYLDHMRQDHPGKFNDAQLAVLAGKNARAAAHLFQTCPLCGKAEVDGSMEDHIVGHMRFLALKSLPSYEEEAGAQADLESQGDSGSSAKVQSRSTLKNGFDSESTGPFSIDDVEGFGAYGIETSATWNDGTEQFPSYVREIISDSQLNRVFAYIPVQERRQFEWGQITASLDSSINSGGDPVLEAFRTAHEEAQGHRLRTPSMPLPTTESLYPDCAICHAPAELACDCEAKALDVAVKMAEDRVMVPIYNDLRQWVRVHSQNHSLKEFNLQINSLHQRVLEGHYRPEAQLVEENEDRDRSQSDRPLILEPVERKSKNKEVGRDFEHDRSQPKRHPGDDGGDGLVSDEVGYKPQVRRDFATWFQSLSSNNDGVKGTQSKETQVDASLPLDHTLDVDSLWQDYNRVWQESVQLYPSLLEYHYSLAELSMLPPDDDPRVKDPPSSAFSGWLLSKKDLEEHEPQSEKEVAEDNSGAEGKLLII